jgi:hypothetical protein
VDDDDLARWRDLLRLGRNDEVLHDLRRTIENYYGIILP